MPKSGPFETISNDDIPFGLNAAQTTAPQSATETTVANLDPPGTVYEMVDLYFIRNATVIRVQRSMISPVDTNGALAALTEGLIDDSTTVGLRSAIPTSLKLMLMSIVVLQPLMQRVRFLIRYLLSINGWP